MAKKPLSEHLFPVNMLKAPNHCLNLHCSIFIRFFDHSKKKLPPKKSVLVLSEILRLFFNILTPDENYFLSVKGNV